MGISEGATGQAKRLADAVDLRDFLDTAGTLTLADRRTLVEQALVLIEQNYAHLPLKIAMYAVNPVQRLRLLALRLSRQTAATADPEPRFHAELSEIFHSVRDLHTNYLLPQPYASKVAYLPFLIEECHEDGRPRYLVTRLVEGFSAPGLEPGAEVTHWNGTPIGAAVDANAARYAGGNPAARHSRGLQSLTIRPLVIHLPPGESWVTLGYLGRDGIARELREPWRVTDNPPPFVDAGALTEAAVSQGLDLGTDAISRALRMLYVPRTLTAEIVDATGTDAPGADLPTSMPAFFKARAVDTPSGTFGHIRVFTFNTNDPGAFVGEFVRLAGLLPRNGLVVDVRGNGGGHIHAAEFLLQTLTPHRITPEPTQFVTTPLNVRICAQHEENPTGQIDLGPWCPSMNQALEIGAVHSAGFAITPEAGANAIGQCYHGPVVLITDARCYSATDIFAAGFQDHGIGPVLGVDDNTGAGGANVWTHELLKLLLELPSPAPGSPYRPLPGGAGMRVSVRRTLRVHELAGTPVEDLGVRPGHRHRLTRRDILAGNQDLLDRAGELLAALPARRLDVRVAGAADELTLRTGLLDRADVYLDGRPRLTVDLTQETVTVTVPGLAAAQVVRVEGFQSGRLVAARTLRP
ncbi:S41 family peptidase [Nonomuraea sp. C10]|uniref:S41 family peptidase n=1 Tax=Nonomuraea sp. C10 TaxID=2600577 RepID=UPI0011CE765A|nr:S41 family peptidase [Nonomuraea sp. C10]TXK39696.1 peptidase S41 [Nonomuraea sp. C10]